MSNLKPVPYKGNEAYVFISYAHRDKEIVYTLISEMTRKGLRIWFDEGIDPGTEWDNNIASHVHGCDSMIAFISDNYLASDNCKDELNYARDLNKDRLLVYLEKVELPMGMAMRMNRLQAIHWYTYSNQEDFYDRLMDCPFIGRSMEGGSGSGTFVQKKKTELAETGNVPEKSESEISINRDNGKETADQKEIKRIDRRTLPKPYYGEEDYIYISYHHDDSQRVYEIITSLHSKGYRIWHDNGVLPGNSFIEIVAKTIRNCKVFFCFLSRKYTESQFCIKELQFARAQNKTIVPIMLEDFELPDEIEPMLPERKMLCLSLFDSSEKYAELITVTEAEDLATCRATQSDKTEPESNKRSESGKQQEPQGNDVPVWKKLFRRE